MLMWVAREKSPIGREEAITPVCYLPLGEKKVPSGVLILPAEQAGVLVMSGPHGAPAPKGQNGREEPAS
jgi:hypothetical protein